MISLISLLEEINSPKAIILGGGAGSGKTYITNNLLGKIKGDIFIPKGSNIPFRYLNPDDIVEKENLDLGSAMVKFKELFNSTKDQRENILWDTTGSNVKNTLGQLDGYNKLMIMVYTHPIISILQNFSRNRKLPLKAVINTWNKVYGNIGEYKNLLGDNFILIQNIIPGYEKDIKEFNQAASQGKEALKQYLDSLINSNPTKFDTTFRKEFNFDSEEIATDFEGALNRSSYNEATDSDFLKQVKKDYQKAYQKINQSPGSAYINKRLEAAKKSSEKQQSNFYSDLDNIISKLLSPEFKQIITPNTESEVISKLNQFINNG